MTMTAAALARDVMAALERGEGLDGITLILTRALSAEQLDDARAICPHCAAGDELFYDAYEETWLHRFIPPPPGLGASLLTCRAAAIWERMWEHVWESETAR